jgi:hypothetical protein
VHGCREIEGKTRDVMLGMSSPDSAKKDLAGPADSTHVDADENLDFAPNLGDEDEFESDIKD